jgi:prepilin-type processing-associated H-X9-DG protein
MLAWPGASVLGLDMHGKGLSSTNAGAQNADIPYEPNPDPLIIANVLMPNLPPGTPAVGDEMRECTNSNEADAQGMPCVERSSPSNSAAPRSLHPGGVHVAKLDGSVDFLRDEIDARMLALLVCIHDGFTVEQQ